MATSGPKIEDYGNSLNAMLHSVESEDQRVSSELEPWRGAKAGRHTLKSSASDCSSQFAWILRGCDAGPAVLDTDTNAPSFERSRFES